ncbi:MAG: efflux RND transporter periplasmic adaptor subunit [Gemmatimonadales bacterium]
MNAGTRPALGITVVVIATAAIVWFGKDGSAPSSSGGQDMADMPGMEGMAGMPGMDMASMGSDGSVTLSAVDVATFGVTFGSVERRPVTRLVRAVGIVEFDEARMAYLAPKFDGWAERLHVDFTGARVRAGDPLLDVYAPELVAAQEELLLAARLRETARADGLAEALRTADELYAAARRRLEYWDVSEDQLERVLASGEPSRTLTLHAPASGVVMQKNVVRGQAFESGSSLYMIADLTEVWVNAEIFAQDAPLVREGMAAQIAVEGLVGQLFTGRIEYVYPTVQDQTRSMRARVSLPNAEGRLKPGMYATVRLRADLGEALTVPTTAVLRTGDRAVAFVDLGEGSLMPQEVQLGFRGDDVVQVISGLEPGQRVVTSAQYVLDSESNLAEVMRAMMAQMNLSDMGTMDMEGMDMGGMDMSPPGGR